MSQSTEGAPIVVFAGPSLLPSDRQRGGFDWRPPAQAGDLITLIGAPPARLCLIDGLFDTCAAPWHKELLLLMAAGTEVYGAASMGALRAAELRGYGMVGVGAIYHAFRDGLLHGDDEVALLHATARLGWAPVTVPMVEVRATLALSCSERMLDVALARRIVERARDIDFGDRDWPLMEAVICDEARLIDRTAFRRPSATAGRRGRPH